MKIRKIVLLAYQGCATPVSYTHLDVYKRQDLNTPMVITLSLETLFPFSKKRGLKNLTSKGDIKLVI